MTERSLHFRAFSGDRANSGADWRSTTLERCTAGVIQNRPKEAGDRHGGNSNRHWKKPYARGEALLSPFIDRPQFAHRVRRKDSAGSKNRAQAFDIRGGQVGARVSSHGSFDRIADTPQLRVEMEKNKKKLRDSLWVPHSVALPRAHRIKSAAP